MAAAEDVKYGLDLAGVDPAALVDALVVAGAQAAREPEKTARAIGRATLDEASVFVDVVRHALGGDGSGGADDKPGDRRFADRAWSENPFLRWLAGTYLVSSASARGLVESLDLPEPKRRKARFAVGVLLDAMAPTNVPWLNPTVVKETIDTGGLNLVRGLRNFADDALHNNGLPRQVDPAAFDLGRDLAATPGRVVYRNELFELLAYEPQTDEVYAHPVLYVPSWINKYYVLDLAPGRSFVEYAVRAGFTVFAVSYRNPDASMSSLTLDDYLRRGLLTALARTAELTGSPKVNLLGVCVGGTMTAIALAVLTARGDADRVASATLLNALVDYHDPGEIGAFTDEETVERLERRMNRRGYLSPSELAGPFTWMRSNDLVWRYVVSNWYLGRRPPAFDVLAWNADSTRLPAAMHSQFLRTCYLDNALVDANAAVVDGTPVDLSRVATPLYVLAAENDHIAPWRSAYRTTQLVHGDTRFTLAAGGHIVGMVSPPAEGRSSFFTSGKVPPAADDWRRGARREHGSWWDDWVAWAATHSGGLVPPPALPDGDPAPGEYVRG
jgi:polyhydroxyalkanoate synthase